MSPVAGTGRGLLELHLGNNEGFLWPRGTLQTTRRPPWDRAVTTEIHNPDHRMVFLFPGEGAGDPCGLKLLRSLRAFFGILISQRKEGGQSMEPSQEKEFSVYQSAFCRETADHLRLNLERDD